jgi:putative endonuclease
MAFTRSAVRSRLAPPAFARFATARQAGITFRSEASEGCRAEVPKERRRAMKYVYILQSINSAHFYVGIADDLRARLAKHNAGEVSHTSKFRPWQVKTYIAFNDEKQVFSFEKYLKSPSGRAFAKKRL